MLADFLVAESFRHQLDDLALPWRQQLTLWRMSTALPAVAEQRFRHHAGAIALVPRKRPHRREQVLLRVRFQDDTPGADLQRADYHRILLAIGKQTDLDLRQPFVNVPRRLKSVHSRHGTVDDGDVRRRTERRIDR